LLKYQQTEFDTNNLFINPYKEWPYTDWAKDFILDGPVTRATSTLFIIHGIREAVSLLRELGDTANADKYSAWADQLTESVRAQLADSNTHTFGDRLQENAQAVLSGVATPEQYTAIAPIFRAGSPAWVVPKDFFEVMSPYYGYFVLNAMKKLDLQQDALDLIRRYWGDMLKRGATTWWEEFDPSWPDVQKTLDRNNYLSMCHGWSSGPTSYLTETVLGVVPTSGGYKTVDIAPQLGDLTWAEGDVPTPNGLIHVRVDRRGDSVTAAVALPAHVSATISLGGKSLKADKAGNYHLTAP